MCASPNDRDTLLMNSPRTTARFRQIRSSHTCRNSRGTATNIRSHVRPSQFVAPVPSSWSALSHPLIPIELLKFGTETDGFATCPLVQPFTRQSSRTSLAMPAWLPFCFSSSAQFHGSVALTEIWMWLTTPSSTTYCAADPAGLTPISKAGSSRTPRSRALLQGRTSILGSRPVEGSAELSVRRPRWRGRR